MYISNTAQKVLIGSGCFVGGGVIAGLLSHVFTKKVLENRVCEDLGLELEYLQQSTGHGYLMSLESGFYDETVEEIKRMKEEGIDISLEDFDRDEDSDEIDDGIEEFEDERSAQINIHDANSQIRIVDTVQADVDKMKTEYNSLTKKYSEMKDQIDSMKVLTEHPTEEDLPIEPYIITAEEFADENLNYDKVGVTYLMTDGVVIDEVEDIFEDCDRYLGEENLKLFAEHEELAMLYIRNEANYIDYEVEKVYSDYMTYTGKQEVQDQMEFDEI